MMEKHAAIAQNATKCSCGKNAEILIVDTPYCAACFKTTKSAQEKSAELVEKILPLPEK